MACSNPSSALSASHPASQGNDGPKKAINVQSDGSVTGAYQKEWHTRIGEIVRAIVPVSDTDWRKVPTKYKDDVWNALEVEFEFDVPTKTAPHLLSKSSPQRFRTFKAGLRDLLKLAPSVDAVIQAIPESVDPDFWKGFVTNEHDPKKKEQCEENAKIWKKLKHGHTLGHCIYVEKQRQVVEKNPDATLRRVHK